MRFARTEVRAEAVLVPQLATRVPAAPVAPATLAPHPPEVPARSEASIRNTSSAWRSAATAGLVGVLLSLLPLGVVLGFPLAGFLAVIFYRRRTWGVELSPSAGFRLGLLTGFAMSVVLGPLVAFSTGSDRQRLIDGLHQQQARALDPQARQMLDYFLTPNGLATLIIASLIVAGILFVLLSGLGGAVSAWLQRRKRPEN